MHAFVSARARELARVWRGKKPETLLRLAFETFGPERLAFATSFGAEDQVVTDLLYREELPVSLFTLDTGRLPQETYDAFEATRQRYGLQIEVLFPEALSVERMVTQHGPNLFYASVENRRECCRIRKIEPLRKKLSTLDAWICGLRRGQSVTRQDIDIVEWDESFGVFKINPLAEVSEAWVWEYIRTNGVPYNRLHDRGFPSIGCSPCTRAVDPGEDVRAGRWWWEHAEHRECGLHRHKDQ
ncbi:MAG: phosphoadenylyl-sulfate reductase [Chlorobiaceae bacterium]|nr:phosphoadenylyl-sulfate reductase [Chlorobiaceae bacterium]